MLGTHALNTAYVKLLLEQTEPHAGKYPTLRIPRILVKTKQIYKGVVLPTPQHLKAHGHKR